MLSLTSFAQKWTSRGEENGIKGYTRTVGDKLEMKFVTQSKASMSAFVGVMRDVSSHQKWMTGIQKSVLLKEKAIPFEIYYHSVVPFPWPMDNRDAVMYGVITQDPDTKALFVKLRPIPTYLPEEKKHIRIKTFEMDVMLKPQKNGTTYFESIMRVGEDDGMPTWLLDWVVTEKFFKVIHNLCELAQKEPYKSFSHPSVVNK